MLLLLGERRELSPGFNIIIIIIVIIIILINIVICWQGASKRSPTNVE